LKSKTLKGKVYSKLIQRLFYQTIAVLGVAVVLVMVLRAVLRGKFADFLVSLIGILWGTDTKMSALLYQWYIRNNLDIIIVITMIICFLILLRLSYSWFTKYFDQIVTGVDKLAEEADEIIVMSSELKFMEIKLNEVKDKLRKSTAQAQAEAQRKNDLVVYLAHDIKTPLTSVIGYLSLLNEAPDMPAEQKAKYVGITLEKAYRLEQLINEFFEITRFNLQTIVLNKEKINLLFMLQQMADEFYPMLTPQRKQVSVNVPDGLALWGDADKLARVFNNILKNAIVYSYENCVIDISAQQQDENIVITFTNQGNPIPREKLETIFEKFYRLDTSRSTNTGGAGLGLAIAKEIVNAHGGNILVRSNTEKTVFTVVLPQNQEKDK
jgi:two-component system sensor histidine kinase VanS